MLSFKKNNRSGLEKRTLSLEEKVDQEVATFFIQCAFKDVGIFWPVHVYFNPEGYDLNINNACTFNFLNADLGQRESFVAFSYKERDFIQNSKQVYAIAGHEAMHCLHEHKAIQSLIFGAAFPSVYYFMMNACKAGNLSKFCLILVFFNIMLAIVSQLLEMDADLSSVKKLGTAEDLSNYFASLPDSKSILFFSSHPSPATRIEYLKVHLPSRPLFFQGHKKQTKEQMPLEWLYGPN